MKKILLLEPNKAVSDIITEFLEKDGHYRVFSAKDSQSAIHAADTHRPDVVILELAIPMHNGFAFLHEFRSYSDWADIPVVIHSHLARSEAQLSKSWEMLGATRYLYKPRTSLAELRSAIENVCPA